MQLVCMHRRRKHRARAVSTLRAPLTPPCSTQVSPKSRKLRLPQLGARAKKEAAAKLEGAETRARELELQVAALQKVGLQALQASDDASSGAQLVAEMQISEATERAGH